jgi:hypothetical protein
MKKVVLSLVAFAIVWATLGTALAAPKPAAKQATLKVDGKAVKKVPLREGMNDVPLPHGGKLKVLVKNGKIRDVKRIDPAGFKGIAPKSCICLFICVCH